MFFEAWCTAPTRVKVYENPPSFLCQACPADLSIALAIWGASLVVHKDP